VLAAKGRTVIVEVVMQLEYAGVLTLDSGGQPCLGPEKGAPVELAGLLRTWIGQRVKVIVAEGRDRSWIVIEREGKHGRDS
jgi:hypothetical protein